MPQPDKESKFRHDTASEEGREEAKQIKMKRINNEKVEKIPVKADTRKVKGGNISSECYCNIYCLAGTNSGKTTCLYHILKACTDKHTKVRAYVSTAYNDKNWLEIRKYFKRKGIDFEIYTSIIDDGVNHLQELVDQLRDEAEERDKAESESDSDEEVDLMKLIAQTDGVNCAANVPQKEKPEKRRKPKYLAPDYVLIFDDMAEELRIKVYNELLKRSRHYMIKTITSSQYLKDIKPSSRLQIRLWLIFAGQPPDKIEEIYNSLNPQMTLALFQALYERATVKTDECKHPFFYASSGHDFRRNFDEQFIIGPGIF